MTEERKDAFVLTTPTEESPPPPAYSRTWGNDSVKDEGKRRNWWSELKWKATWIWSLQDSSMAAYRTAKQPVKSVSGMLFVYLREIIWPSLKGIRIRKKQCFALLLVIACGIMPFFTIGYLTGFYGIWMDKVLSCGDSFYGTPQNATISGIEKLFVLDSTFGSFTFSQAKTIDIVWDVFLGRGVQLLAWWAAYIVFSDALLRAIERHPASFRIFQRIALEGPSLLSVWTLMKEIWTVKSRRTRALFFYMFLSTCYVLSVPLLLSAMTGYDSTTIAWVGLDDSNNIIPAESLKESWIIWGTNNQTFDKNVCKDIGMYYKVSSVNYEHRLNCYCQLPDGTMISPDPSGYYYASDRSDCKYNYPGNTQTYTGYGNDGGEWQTQNCNATFDVKIEDRIYDARDLNGDRGYCYKNSGYNSTVLYDNSRCLPDTANPSYQWGFSTMMSGMFVFLQFGWCLSMYVVWQDAQFNSTLVKSGYEMTILRAAFAMAKAAKRKTGMGERQLVRANTKELEQELYGGRKIKGTKVDYGIFIDDPEDGGDDREVVRRNVRPKIEPSWSEATLS